MACQARHEHIAEKKWLNDLVDALAAVREHAQAENALGNERHGTQPVPENALPVSEVLEPPFQDVSVLIIISGGQATAECRSGKHVFWHQQ